jgi:hypothetical protein
MMDIIIIGGMRDLRCWGASSLLLFDLVKLMGFVFLWGFWLWSSIVLLLVLGIYTNDIRLRYPLGLVIIVLLSLLATSIVFEHHDVLVRGVCFRLSCF